MGGYLRQQSPGVWRLWVDLPPDPVTGKRRRHTRTLHGTRAEAERQRTQIVADITNARHVDPNIVTWAEFAAEWADLIEATVRPATLYSYRQKAQLVARYIGDRKLADLSGPLLNGMYRRMLADGYSPRTVAHAHTIVHRVMRDAVRWGRAQSNPADRADPPRVARTELATWTAEEVRRFLEVTAGDRLWPLWRTAFTTGMRRGELAGMRWSTVNLQAGIVSVAATRVMVAGQVETGEPKTSSGRRRIALDPVTVDALTAWKEAQDRDRGYFGYTSDWVWAWEDGRPWSPDWIAKQWRARVTELGMRPIRFHDIRHTWATLALEAGVPAKVVADRLGHAGIAITLDTYTHHVPELDRRAADQVAGLFGSNGPKAG